MPPAVPIAVESHPHCPSGCYPLPFLLPHDLRAAMTPPSLTHDLPTHPLLPPTSRLTPEERQLELLAVALKEHGQQVEAASGREAAGWHEVGLLVNLPA